MSVSRSALEETKMADEVQSATLLRAVVRAL